MQDFAFKKKEVYFFGRQAVGGHNQIGGREFSTYCADFLLIFFSLWFNLASAKVVGSVYMSLDLAYLFTYFYLLLSLFFFGLSCCNMSR